MACSLCKKENRVSRHVLVPYMDRRSGQRHCYLACSYHDALEEWPVYAKQYPKVTKE